MHRRDFLHLTAAISLAAPLATLPHAASAAGMAYKPGLIDAELAAGKVVLVDYYATWCSTCAAQQRVIAALRAENPAYDAIRFVEVDWDRWQDDPVTTARNIPRRSTLILLRGKTELMRIVAGTGKAEIKAMLDAGLAAV